MHRRRHTARNVVLALAVTGAVAIGETERTPVLSTQHIDKKAPTAQALTPKASLPELLVGDKRLQGTLNLKKMHLVGRKTDEPGPAADDATQHYEVPLAKKRVARLTLDPDLQKSADKVLQKSKAPLGSIVVMSTDGRILALAGRRTTETGSTVDYKLPVSVWAPAASIFKVVTAASLLSKGVSAAQKTCYHGGLRSVERNMLVDNAKLDRACNDLGYGLAKSQNALIAKLAHKHLTPDILGSTARGFGLGRTRPFALAQEASRILLPTDDLQFARVAAGFWHTEMSALDGALVANVVASGGMRVTPRVVEEVIEKNRHIPVVGEAPKRAIPKRTAALVAKMMTGTVDYGTAFHGFHDSKGRPYLAGTKVAGKTGSLTQETPDYRAYSWFVGFAPVDNPEVVISVLLANPPKWHLKAHTAARLVLDDLF